MPKSQETLSSQDIHQLAREVVSFLEWPAAIVAGGQVVLAHNTLWSQLMHCPSDAGGDLTLEYCLRDFSLVEPLVGALRTGLPPVGEIRILCESDHRPGDEPSTREYGARWRQIGRPGGRALAVVVFEDVSEVDPLKSVISSQRAQIDRLLVRQTLIEEAERKRLGSALHDVVAQDLAQIRAALVKHGVTDVVDALDRVIEDTRTLAFELSPPILEDLGLCPALRWLAEHLSRRYGAPIACADDAREPRLSHETRTIVFRAVRELATNAAKHAAGAEVVISCVTGDRATRIIVRDEGPGFDTSAAHSAADDAQRYGLFSVEQQIRGVGGRFQLVSNIGAGTTATITLDSESEEGAAG